MTTALPPRPALPHDLTSWTAEQLRHAAYTKAKQLKHWNIETNQQLNELSLRAGLTMDYKLLDLANQLAAILKKREAEQVYWQAMADGKPINLPRSLRCFYRKASHNETGCTRNGSWVNKRDHSAGVTWATL